MPYTAIWYFSIFRAHVNKFLLPHSGYSIMSRVSISAAILAPGVSNFADFIVPLITNTQTKYYEMLTTTMETPYNTTCKIAYWCIEFEYHFSTLQHKFRLLLNKGVSRTGLYLTEGRVSYTHRLDWFHNSRKGIHYLICKYSLPLVGPSIEYSASKFQFILNMKTGMVSMISLRSTNYRKWTQHVNYQCWYQHNQFPAKYNREASTNVESYS